MRRKHLLTLTAIACFISAGCISLTPKRDVMKTAIAKTTSRRTSAPRVYQTSSGQMVAVGQEESVTTEVLYDKATPVVAGRSIWSRWYVWVALGLLVTYFGLWPFIIRAMRRLKAKLGEALQTAEAAAADAAKKEHALTTVVKQVDLFKATAKTDPKLDNATQLKTILGAQDPITVAEVKAVRNGS